MEVHQSTPLISILMPAKNAEAYIEECLQSILNQTHEQWELIVVNDHSSDHTNDILARFSDIDQRIRVFQNIDHGIISALRMAYSRAKGKFITRMDADDIMSTQKLELMSRQLDEKGNGFVAVGGVHYFAANGVGDGYAKYAAWLNKLTFSSTNFSEIYKECVVPSPCWMIQRKDLDTCGAFDSDIYPEDYDLCFRFYKAGFHICGITEILHHWRDYSTRSSRTDEHYADNRFLDLKIKYFLELELKSNQLLTLWGAGKKGKLIAQKLIDKNIAFKWVTNNENKIGRDIYGKIIQSSEHFPFIDSHHILVAIANPTEQLQIFNQLKGCDTNTHLFC